MRDCSPEKREIEVVIEADALRRQGRLLGNGVASNVFQDARWDQVAPPDSESRDPRTSRTKQDIARYKALMQSFDRPLAKLGLIDEFVEKHGTVLFVVANEPQSYNEAMASPEKEK
uniref:Uncharacterized protein n=1 Tax=Daphnia galeata TaxID=27404 RepID=A0A8J2RW46_9CRUS|nr:unnamed protein product [Daphnia galeata]